MSRTRWMAVALLATALAGGVAQSAFAGSKQKCRGIVVKTSVPTKLTPVSAVLHGTVDTCGAKHVTASFLLGGRAVASYKVPADKRSHSFSYSVSGLTPGDTVSYRLQAKVGHKALSAKGSLRTPSIVVTTLAASSVGTGSAVLNATGDGDGAAGLKVAFTWSLSGGQQELTAGTALPSDRVSHSFSATLTGLSPATTYSFDAIVIGPKGTLAQCGCGLTFTTSPALTGVHVTAPATATAGQSFDVSAAGIGTGGVSLGDVTSHTVFTITPDGSCAGASCSATVAGPHTIHATDTGFSDTAPTTIDAGPVSYLKLSPAGGTACEELTATNAEFSCALLGPTQAYAAEGYDRYDNDIGDVTASTTFTGGAGCEGANCTIADAGPATITGTDGTATGTATLSGSTPTMTCDGANYDVDDELSDGCEVADTGAGVGTRSEADADAAAASAPECDSGTNADIDISGTIPSDTRVHQAPAITGFDPTTGSTPDWFWISPTSGLTCNNDIVMTLSTSGEASPQSNDCYKLTVITDKEMYSAQTSSVDGTASIDHDTGDQFSDGTHIDVEVSKTCSTNVTEDVSWTLSGHL